MLFLPVVQADEGDGVRVVVEDQEYVSEEEHRVRHAQGVRLLAQADGVEPGAVLVGKEPDAPVGRGNGVDKPSCCPLKWERTSRMSRAFVFSVKMAPSLAMKNSSPFWKTRKASRTSRNEYLSLPLWKEADSRSARASSFFARESGVKRSPLMTRIRTFSFCVATAISASSNKASDQ